MYSSDSVLEAWKRAGGKCECKRWTHSHNVARCGKELVWENRGKAGDGRWEARRSNNPGTDTPNNYEILCSECYKLALYGR